MKNLTSNSPFFFTVTKGRKAGQRVDGNVMEIPARLGGGFSAIKEQVVLKDVYTAKDEREDAARAAAVELVDGETVTIDGQAHRVELHGDFLDCASFHKVAE